mmetsp:Transcript_12779/g.30294  ORF Transcript_12779/g.30294 Transcript_12779/m.30294 type:complete len:376 (-) Transcript_12779:1080-2207(-)
MQSRQEMGRAEQERRDKVLVPFGKRRSPSASRPRGVEGESGPRGAGCHHRRAAWQGRMQPRGRRRHSCCCLSPGRVRGSHHPLRGLRRAGYRALRPARPHRGRGRRGLRLGDARLVGSGPALRMPGGARRAGTGGLGGRGQGALGLGHREPGAGLPRKGRQAELPRAPGQAVGHERGVAPRRGGPQGRRRDRILQAEALRPLRRPPQACARGGDERAHARDLRLAARLGQGLGIQRRGEGPGVGPGRQQVGRHPPRTRRRCPEHRGEPRRFSPGERRARPVAAGAPDRDEEAGRQALPQAAAHGRGVGASGGAGRRRRRGSGGGGDARGGQARGGGGGGGSQARQAVGPRPTEHGAEASGLSPAGNGFNASRALR